MSLPTPYYERNGITIYCGDCREILPLIPDKSIDLVLTDPPYGAKLGVKANNQRFDRLQYESFEDTPEIHTRARIRLPSSLCKPSLRNYFDWEDSWNDDYAKRPILLDLFAGGGGAAMGYYLAGFRIVGVDGVDNMPQGMVIYMYGKIRVSTLCRLWEDSQGSNQEWRTNKSTVPSMRCQTSGDSKTRQLGEKGISSTLERWDSFRTKWLSFNSCATGQPIYFNGRFQGASI